MNDFDIVVTLPADERFTAALRALVAHAAVYAGCAPAEVDSFAEAVEEAMRGCLDSLEPGEDIPIVLRRTAGEVEVLMTCGRVVRVARPAAIDSIP